MSEAREIDARSLEDAGAAMKNEAWPWRPLGELFEIGAGKTMSAAAPMTATNKTPFLRTSNVFWDEIDLATVDEMAISPTHELAEKLLAAAATCWSAKAARSAAPRSGMARSTPCHFRTTCIGFGRIADDVDPRFYVYFLQCGFTQLGIFEGAGNKTTIPNLSRNRLADLEVPHPAASTSSRPSLQSLARVREAIEVHDRAPAIAQDLKRAAMRELFTRGLRGEAQKETEIGPVPESWDVARQIGDVRRWHAIRTSVRGSIETGGISHGSRSRISKTATSTAAI